MARPATGLDKDKNINIRIKKEEFEEFKKICEIQNVSYSWLIRELIRQYIKDYKEKQNKDV